MGLRVRFKPGYVLELTPRPDLRTGFKPLTESGVELGFDCAPEL